MPKKYQLKGFEDIRVSDVYKEGNDENEKVRQRNVNDKWQSSAQKKSFIQD